MILPTLFRRSHRDYRCQQFVEAVTDYLEGAMRSRDRCEHYLAQLRRTMELTGHLRVDDVDALGSQARRQLLDAFRDFHHST